MRRMLIVTLFLLAAASQAFAWSASGHKIVGSIAFRQLTPDQQASIVAILKHHPRYKEDFESKMPEELKTEAEQNEWLFQQAAIWPDIARGFKGDDKAYHHPTWHYIDLPNFLTPEDQAALEGTLKDNVSLDPPATESENMNAVQAIRFARRLLVDKDTPDDKRALMLCWLFHDVGDIHQPLHSTALVSKNLFPTGDRGGNSVKTDQHRNLHSLWDGLLGSAEFREARNKAIKSVNDPELAKLGSDAASNLDEKKWLDESHELAITVVYDPEVIGHLRGFVSEKEAPPLRLSETYLKAAGAAAERRVTEAGYRLGAILNQIADK